MENIGSIHRCGRELFFYLKSDLELVAGQLVYNHSFPYEVLISRIMKQILENIAAIQGLSVVLSVI